jgi:VWFA-related protein
VRYLVASAALVLLVSSGLPSLASPPPPVFKAELELVKVVVTVRDSEGRVVEGLKTEDFTVLEDGQPQVVDFFAQSVDGESGDSRRESLALDVGMLLDTSASMSNTLSLSQQAAVRFLAFWTACPTRATS